MLIQCDPMTTPSTRIQQAITEATARTLALTLPPTLALTSTQPPQAMLIIRAAALESRATWPHRHLALLVHLPPGANEKARHASLPFRVFTLVLTHIPFGRSGP